LIVVLGVVTDAVGSRLFGVDALTINSADLVHIFNTQFSVQVFTVILIFTLSQFLIVSLVFQVSTQLTTSVQIFVDARIG
jgi:cell shape-determining protein MreD